MLRTRSRFSTFPAPLCRSLPLAVLLGAGCNGGLSIVAGRGDQTAQFSGGDCAVELTGNSASGKDAVDLTCPPTLISVDGQPTLHLSVPLATKPAALPLQDPDFGQSGYQPGQFVVVTLSGDSGPVTCDPLKATGSVTYTAIPQNTGGTLAGSFSSDAALLDCKGDSSGQPLTLSGSFSLDTPPPGQ